MFECPNIPVPKTAQELEQAIRSYRKSDLKGVDLYCQWQVIRDAALAQNKSDLEGDRVPGEDSY